MNRELRRTLFRVAGLILAIAVVVSAVSSAGRVRAQAAVKYYKIQGVWVGFDASTGTLTWSGGEKGINYIPKKIDGKTVKVIGEWAYNDNANIKTAKIPATVKKIEKGAFYGCPNLKKVVFPKKFKAFDIEEMRTFWDSNKLKTVKNNPDKAWKARIKTFDQTIEYLSAQDPQYYVDNVREFKNQWIVAEDGSHIDYTDEAWDVVVKKAKELTKGCKTDMEKAKAISKWIVGYLHYDDVWMKKFKEWRKTHDEDKEVFPLRKVTDAYGLITWDPAEHEGETATTTCGGYGNLTQALFCASGIPCVHVHRVQKEGESIDHVFNVTYIDGKWRWIDNTYSDETLNYFDCEIAGMSASDHRCDRLNLEYLTDLMK
ncbi:MAG: leucine-rich repeat protein [Lachnospiraceae bacterium]|nr:leucine-rich repeat protein [Lachnospiraceae bacterium]